MAQARPSHDLVACVVAWHNRHPLARRITAAQVVSVGLVSFPFQAPGRSRPASEPTTAAEPGDDAAAPAPGGSLRERASARARAAAAAHDADAPSSAEGGQAGGVEPATPQRKGWRAAFSENLLDPISPRQVARWALRHGSERRPGPPEAPVREIDATGPGASAPLARLWVFTAAIDCGAQRVRVLVAPFDARRVIGPRIIGRGRVQAASAGVAALGAGAAAWVLAWGGADQRPLAAVAAPVPMAAVSAVSAASAALAAAAAPSASASPAVPPASAPAVAQPPRPSEAHASHVAAADPAPPPAAGAASAPGVLHGAEAATTETAAPAIPPTPPMPSADGRLRLAPVLSDEVRLAAREASEAARAERARRSGHGHDGSESTSAHAPGTAPSPPVGHSATAAAPSGTHASTTPAPPAATAWAVSTRRLRTRFESEQMLAALRDVAYREGRGSEFKLEVLPAGEDWQAVGWPLATRAEAERLRDALAARGLKADVVQF